jgi:uncharacterized protein (TIGR02265 family)
VPVNRIQLRVEVPLRGELDELAAVEAVPEDFLLKGMFFKRLTEGLGPAFGALKPQLESPPRGGYLNFKDYPQRDYTRLHFALAKKRYPKLSSREAVRRIAREDFDVFAQSVLGKVIVALVRDARTALHKVPEVYQRVAPGDWNVAVSDVDDATVGLEFHGLPGVWEYQVGQLEGIARAFGAPGHVQVEQRGPNNVLFLVQVR